MSEISQRWNRVPPMLRFIGVFVITLLVLAIVFPWLSVRYNQQMMVFMSGTAWLVSQALTVLGETVMRAGRFISGSGFSIEVIEECTGAYEILILWAAVIAYPARWRAKLIGVGGGAVILVILNIIRMTVLFLVGQYLPQWFEFMHTYFWQATLILMILTVWISWIRLVAARTPSAGA